MKAVFKGVFLLNGDFDGAKAQAALAAGEADAITFGRTFLANPDLPRRIKEAAPLNKDDKSTWYTQGREGYLDYPALDGGTGGAGAPQRYLRYSPDVETIQPDEAQAIDGIIRAMTKQSTIVAQREHDHAVRASHAKSTGLAVGEMTILPNLPTELAQGLFAKSGSYKVAVRFAQGPGETLPDKVSTHRGMAIKVFGVEGEKLPGHSDETQDFVPATGATFPSGTAQKFLKDEKQILTATGLPAGIQTGLKSAVSAIMRNANLLLQAIGSGSSKAGFFGHPFTPPLSDSYHSQAPIRYGDYVAKIAAFPVTPAMKALAGTRVDVKKDPDGFRHATVGFFRENDVIFDLRVQLWTSPKSQPIEDTSVEWPESESPYVTVATITLPRQEAYSPERQRFFDDIMTFRPAHSLVAHRPLGSIMRARLKVYEALSAFRHKHNAIKSEEPADPARIPA